MLKHVTLKSGVCYYLAMNAGDADSSLVSNERVMLLLTIAPPVIQYLLIEILLQAASNRTMTSTVFLCRAQSVYALVY